MTNFAFNTNGGHTRGNPAYGFQTTALLKKIGIKIPKRVDELRATADKLEKRQKEFARNGGLEHAETAVLSALADDPTADITEHLVGVATVELEGKAITKTLYVACLEHGQELQLHADALVAAIAKTAFTNAQTVIAKAAALDTTDLKQLADQRRTDDILLVSEAHAAFDSIAKMTQLRDDLCFTVGRAIREQALDKRYGYYGKPLSLWRNPRNIVDEANTFDAYIANTKAGAEPWFATPDQIQERVRELLDEDAEQPDQRNIVKPTYLPTVAGIAAGLTNSTIEVDADLLIPAAKK